MYRLTFFNNLFKSWLRILFSFRIIAVQTFSFTFGQICLNIFFIHNLPPFPPHQRYTTQKKNPLCWYTTDRIRKGCKCCIKKTFKQVLLTVDSFKTIYFYTETILRPATTRTRSEWAQDWNVCVKMKLVLFWPIYFDLGLFYQQFS